MSESSVIYVPASGANSGAVPFDTPVATHDRASDGAEVQDVFIDPDSVIPLDTMALYLSQVISLLTRLVDEQKETNRLLGKIYQ